MKKIGTVLFVGMNPWHMREIYDTVRFLASAWKGADRLYIEPPRGLKGSLSDPKQLLREFRWGREVCEGIEIFRPPLGFAPVFLGLRGQADGFAAAGLDRLMKKRCGDSWRERTLVYISSWSYTQTNFIKKLNPRYLVFHILDDSFAFPLIRDCPRVLAENKMFYCYMMSRSSAVLAVSPELAQKYCSLYGRRVRVVKNGVDPEHFSCGGVPAQVPEMDRIPGPVLMYTGSINSWVDLPLLLRLAGERPQYSLVLIGHHYAGTVDPVLWEELLKKPNVYWLKSRPYGQLPAYIRYASALLLPRTGAEHSRASDPLKLYEYLSTGKPVVSTALPSVEDFREFVYVAPDPAGFASAVDVALKNRDPAAARRQAEMMENHSWRARVGEIRKIMSEEAGILF
ncbi:MAG TPA: glycosyltransferase [Bacillota bacterium]|nr:glycosyltransferase [Bacillota bacterium]